MTTSALTAAALAAKRERGEKTGGDAPIGTTADDAGRLVVDEAEAAAVATIRELRAAGLSIRAIAETLNARGIPARGGRWHPTTVARVLARIEWLTPEMEERADALVERLRESDDARSAGEEWGRMSVIRLALACGAALLEAEADSAMWLRKNWSAKPEQYLMGGNRG